jgi:hypothetical protein
MAPHVGSMEMCQPQDARLLADLDGGLCINNLRLGLLNYIHRTAACTLIHPVRGEALLGAIWEALQPHHITMHIYVSAMPAGISEVVFGGLWARRIY